MPNDLQLLDRLKKEFNNNFQYKVDEREYIIKLHLKWLKLKYIPNYVFELSNLTELSLFGNKLVEIPEQIGKLSNLKILDLGQNSLTGLPFSFQKIVNLKDLNLWTNKLSEFPAQILHLTNLVSLTLGNNNIISIPKEIDKLSNLKYLYLQNNKIRKFPREIISIKSLQELYLQYNLIEDFPENIDSIDQVQTERPNFIIDLRDNKISELPEIIADYKHIYIDWELESWKKQNIFLEGNPLIKPPVETLKRGRNDIKNYFNSLKKDEFDNLNELKLLLVGEGSVGKTSIAKALSNQNFKLDTQENKTEGINILSWLIPGDEFAINNDFRINIWDFGGQEIYHSTHQFFLTRRAFYLLITESRQEDKHEDFFYWLNIIQRLSNNSPVIIIQNKIDVATKEIPINEYKNRFKNIIDFHRVSCTSDYAATVNNLIDSIKRTIYNKELFPHIGSPLPKVWVKIRDEIENLRKSGKKYISYEEYLALCSKFSLDEKGAIFLSRFYHDLGIILHFNDPNDDPVLRDTIFISYKWILDALYKILDSKEIIEKKGIFTFEDLKNIWNDRESKDKRLELLTLMKCNKFRLCLELDTGKYLYPQLLPVDEIDLSNEWSPKDNLNFEFRYPFMPKGILIRLIVMMHKDIYDQKYWRYGVLLMYDKTKALIREMYFDRKITISLNGGNKKEFLDIIVKNIQEINNEFNLSDAEQWIPCNCEECSKSTDPTYFEYDELKQYYKEGERFIKCRKDHLKNVDVGRLLSTMLKSDGYPMNPTSGNCEGKSQRFKSNTKNYAELEKSNSGSIKKTIRIFISYSHVYREYFLIFMEKLRLNLKALSNFSVEIFEDTKIVSGEKWDQTIQDNIMDCDCAILLVSDAFLASTYIMNNEIELFKTQMQKNKVVLLPVYFYPCDFYQYEVLSQIQFFKRNGKEFGRPDKSEDFCFADLIKFKETDGTLIPNPEISRYIQDFVKELVKIFSKIG